MDGHDIDHDHYFIVAIAPDGEVVQHSEVCEEYLDLISIGEMPKGGYVTCIAISTFIH